MWLTKFKAVALGLLVVGVGVLSYPGRGAAQGQDGPDETPAGAARPPHASEPPVVERRTKIYVVRCTVTQAAANGESKVVAEPTLGVQEGQEGRFLSGGEQAVPGVKEGTTEFVEFGLSMRVKVNALADGRLRVEAVLERSEPTTTDDGVQVQARSVRAIKRVKLGDTVKLVEKDEKGEPRHWALLRVVNEEEVFSRSRSAEAKAPHVVPARVGQIFIVGTKTIEHEVILRQLPLFSGNPFTFADLRAGERNLERLGLFRVEPEKGIRPTVTVVDADADPSHKFKDILVTVEEKPVPAASQVPQK